MMYSEFIEKTSFGEKYITYTDYTKYIEPVYMYGEMNQRDFCKWFYKLHNKAVNTPVEMLISAKTIDELDHYINGESDIMNDVEQIHITLKDAFLKNFYKNNITH